jgi:regulatory protein
MPAGPDQPVAEAVQWLARHGVKVPLPAGAGTGPAASGPPGEVEPDTESGGSDVDADSREADPHAVARAIVVGKLAARAQTRHELEQALRTKKVPPAIAQQVLDRMASVGLIDDTAFATAWVELRQRRRHLSASAMRRELQAKGVDRDTIEAALAPVDDEAELVAARALVARKSAAMAHVDDQVRYRRLAGLLSRRGFGPAVIARVLDEHHPGNDLDRCNDQT